MNGARVRRLLALAMNASTSSDGGRLDDDGDDVLLVNRAIAIAGDGINHSAHRTLELLPAFTVFAATQLLKSLQTELLINLRIKRRVTSLRSHDQEQGHGPGPKRQAIRLQSLAREDPRSCQAIAIPFFMTQPQLGLSPFLVLTTTGLQVVVSSFVSVVHLFKSFVLAAEANVPNPSLELRSMPIPPVTALSS